jgi:hypothetical protein
MTDALRVQWGEEEAPSEQQQPQRQSQVHDGHFSFGGTGEGVRHVSATVSDFSGRHGSGILSTARNVGFGNPAATLTPDTLVEWQGTQMKLREAEALELVHRDASGRYVEGKAGQQPTSGTPQQPPSEPQQAPQEEQQQVDEMAQEPFASEVEQEVIQLVADASHEAIRMELVDFGSHFVETGELKFNAEHFASRAGMTVENAEKFGKAYLGALASQVDQILEHAGIGKANADAFIEWARINQPSQLKHAWAAHAVARTTLGWRQLVHSYIRQTTPTAEGLQQAGYETRMEGKERMVKLNGQWISVRAAANQGLV